MKRKINLVGTNTLTVSIPSKWVKERHLKKGDDVDITPQGNDLVLSAEGVPAGKSVELDISAYGAMTGRVVGALYKAGFDEMKLNFIDPESAKLVEKELSKGFFGLDMVHSAKNYCLLKSMAEIKPEELQTSIRRVFRLILDNAEDLLYAVQEKQFEELAVIASKDVNVNKFADFSRRLLNKHGYPGKEKASTVYYIVEELENVGDKYRELALYFHRHKFSPNKDVLQAFVKVKDFLDLFQDLFYGFKPEKYRRFGEQYHALKRDIEKTCDVVSGRDLVILVKLDGLVNAIFDLNGPLMTLQFG